jgi:hypothetical protein
MTDSANTCDFTKAFIDNWETSSLSPSDFVVYDFVSGSFIENWDSWLDGDIEKPWYYSEAYGNQTVEQSTKLTTADPDYYSEDELAAVLISD